MNIIVFITLAFLVFWSMFGIFFFGSLIDNTVQKKKWIVCLIGGPFLWIGFIYHLLYSKLVNYLRKE